MASKFLNDTGLAYFWAKIKALIPTKISDVTNDSQYVTESWVEQYVEEHTSESSVIVIEEELLPGGGISDNITTKLGTPTVTDTIDEGGGTIRNIEADCAMYLQSKSVTPSDAQQRIIADSGYDGLSEVIVAPQDKPESLTILFKQENGYLILDEVDAIPNGVGVSF